jgi:hypothetical protein
VFGSLTVAPHTGQAIGSVLIDEGFQKEVEERLNLIDLKIKNQCGLSKYAAQDMTKNSFEWFKVKFREKIQTLLNEISIRVPGLRQDFNHANAKISQGRMIFTE